MVAAAVKVVDPDPAQSSVFSDKGQIETIYELILMSLEQTTGEVKLTTLGCNLPNTTSVCCVTEAKLANRPSSL